MVLTTKQENKLKEMPIIESRVTKSKDGNYLIHRTTITTIRPTSYYEAIIANNLKIDEEILMTDEDLKRFIEGN